MIMRVKKIPMESTCPEFWKVEFMPDPTPRCWAGRLFITPARLGAANAPMARPFRSSSDPERRVVEVDGQEFEQDEGEGGGQHAAGGERPEPKWSERKPESGPAMRKPAVSGQHVDAGPQRRAGEVVAVQGQPDALQPDDQHEHQPASADAGQQGGDAAGREGPDPEQREAEHGVGDPRLDEEEGHQQGTPPARSRYHRARPPMVWPP